MKKIIPILLVIIIILTSCSSTPKDSTVSEEIDLESAGELEALPLDQLTYEDFLNDYDYFWETLEENYPFLGVMKRRDYDLDAIRTGGREKIKEGTTLVQFAKIMADTVDEFSGVGHMEFIYYPSVYNGYLDLYLSRSEEGYNSHKDYLFEVLSGPKTVEVYKYLINNGIISDDTAQNSQTDIEGVTTKTIEENKIAYVKIPTFDINSYDDEIDGLLKFYESVKTSSNLIIDIRGNGGGSDMFWTYGIVEPLINEKLDIQIKLLFNDTELIQKYLKENGLYSFKGDIDAIGNLENLEEEDREKLTNSWVVKDFISPRSPKIGFDGKIWLLVDEDVYSSAESFTMICKATNFATIIGVNTKGDGAGIDPLMFSMPNTGLVWRNSIFYSINPDGSNNEEYGTTPDIIVTENQDALDICLEEIAKA